MSFGWIDPSEYSINSLLLFDKWIVKQISRNSNQTFLNNLSIVLASNPVILWYFDNICPEQKEHYNSLVEKAQLINCDKEEAEQYILNELDWAIVYIYPQMMENLPYIREWKEYNLLSIKDFTGKIVLDIGCGTGRLTFAAAHKAKYIYAMEPCFRLRDYLETKRKSLGNNNVFVVDGTIEHIPFQDEFFDIVMSGHVVGENVLEEHKEMNRVLKEGGCIIDCPGEDDRRRPDGPSIELLKIGFEYLYYKSVRGGDVYRYWKVKRNGNSESKAT